MQLLPTSLQKLIDAFGNLPGVGPRTAERYATYMLRSNKKNTHQLAEQLLHLHEGVKQCPKTFALINADEQVSPLYENPIRDKQLVAVVEDALDVVAIEKSGQFKGTYHVLGGVISPIDGIGPEQLHVHELLTRIIDDNVKEVIIATNANVEGETTALYLQRQLQEATLAITISRLARGLPVGVDLEYADHITLKHALEGRKNIT